MDELSIISKFIDNHGYNIGIWLEMGNLKDMTGIQGFFADVTSRSVDARMYIYETGEVYLDINVEIGIKEILDKLDESDNLFSGTLSDPDCLVNLGKVLAHMKTPGWRS